MKRYAFLFCVVLTLVLVTGCSRDNTTTPTQSVTTEPSQSVTANPEAVAAELVARAGWEIDAGAVADSKNSGPSSASAAGYIVSVDREVVVDDIVHYSFVVRVGDGMYDNIGIHRVVRESRPHQPMKSTRNVFLLHGDLIGWEGIFLFGANSATTPDDYSAAVYLAQNGVDVWGMDQNWVLVPADAMDLSFMDNWGLQNQADNLGIGLAVARHARLATGNGFGKMIAGGYSSGAWTCYAYLDGEAQLPPGHRHVKGYIALDGNFKTDNEADRLGWCELAAYYQWLNDTGVYGDDFSFFPLMSDLARTDPGGPSPVFEGFTNIQAAWGMGSYPAPPPDWYHYLAGEFDDDGMPTGLTATRTDAWLDFMLNNAAFEPTQFEADYSKTACDEIDVPWDDHLGDINVPVLLIAPSGGLGESNYYTLTLLGSSDVTIVAPRFDPPVDLELEFGHIDIWTADVVPDYAKDQVWTPVLNWILDHSPQGPPVDVVRGKN